MDLRLRESRFLSQNTLFWTHFWKGHDVEEIPGHLSSSPTTRNIRNGWWIQEPCSVSAEPNFLSEFTDGIGSDFWAYNGATPGTGPWAGALDVSSGGYLRSKKRHSKSDILWPFFFRLFVTSQNGKICSSWKHCAKTKWGILLHLSFSVQMERKTETNTKSAQCQSDTVEWTLWTVWPKKSQFHFGAAN